MIPKRHPSFNVRATANLEHSTGQWNPTELYRGNWTIEGSHRPTPSKYLYRLPTHTGTNRQALTHTIDNHPSYHSISVGKLGEMWWYVAPIHDVSLHFKKEYGMPTRTPPICMETIPLDTFSVDQLLMGAGNPCENLFRLTF